jgi:hypothetical protein
MRRENFDVHVSNTEWVGGDGEPSKPTVAIEFDGPGELLQSRLAGTEGTVVDADETDVNYRFHADGEDEGEGVLSITNRITGDFVLELNAGADGILEFIRAARAYGDHTDADGRYRITVAQGGEQLLDHEKSTFLVYNDEGNLVRRHSLIPGGVEL